MADAIPIFVISFDRGHYLSTVIQSYRAQDIDVDVIIHDNGSTDPDTLEILSKLSSDGLRVFRYPAISTPDELNKVDESVRRYTDDSGYVGPYVVTDCDVDLSEARPDALRTYLEFLERFDDVECVGPMLRIADIPRSYPLFNRVMARHISQFWGRQPDWVQLRAGKIAYLKHRIDTTFAVHRTGSSFQRLKHGIRVYHPFEARHLDWYVGEGGPGGYRANSSAAISHWDNDLAFAKYASLAEAVQSYTIVEGEVGNLRTAFRSTLDNPP